MKKRFRLLTTQCAGLMALLALASGFSAATASEDRPPNVVVFLVDDLGYMDIGANNPDCFYETPHVNALARSGMRFTNGYAANPVCSPTRYSLMTGKYPTRVGATNFFPKDVAKLRSGRFKPAPLVTKMPLDEIPLPQALKAKNYATFFAGKWHLGESEEYYPQNRGFDVNIGGYSAGGPYTGKKYFAPFENPQMEESPEGDHLPDRLARETAVFIEANKDQPFLAYLSFYSVHTPLIGRPDLVEKYKKKAALIEGEEFSVTESEVTGRRGVKTRSLQKHAVYAAMVEAMDLAVGKVLQQLDDSGVADNTIVIFTSDNGGLSTSEGSPTSNLPLRGGKGWVYEGGIREPWIIRYPGVTEAGSISDEMICSIDLYPTVMSAVGVETSHVIDGIDITKALEGGSLERDTLYWHYPHYSNQGGIPGGAIRVGDYKLVERYEDGEVMLFNLKEDLGEQHDLSAQFPERVTQMRANLHAWYDNVGAKFLQQKGNGPEPWRP
ncbi:sulfatase [Coraliomargarita algicola]|uniref:Sulfatase n=1 Tax=Coraliomargarita algicola TaxID=3092156 RepID=A0ABZ0RLX8_9BACT|nr:sulfatase [Coraliomargarita sp. J2-16]WPJ95995.1 sulfatase [Coraliomargarita sp. J2-16]